MLFYGLFPSIIISVYLKYISFAHPTTPFWRLVIHQHSWKSYLKWQKTLQGLPWPLGTPKGYKLLHFWGKLLHNGTKVKHQSNIVTPCGLAGVYGVSIYTAIKKLPIKLFPYNIYSTVLKYFILVNAFNFC